MIIKTTYFTANGAIARYINLAQVVSFGVAEGSRAEEGFNTVLFMPNGYAMFSTLTVEELAALYNSNI